MRGTDPGLVRRAGASLQSLLDEGVVVYGQDKTGDLLPIQDALVIEYVGRLSPLSMSELATACGVLPNTMTGIVDRLVQRGLVIRDRAEKDRRIVTVALTPAGHGQLVRNRGFLDEFSRSLLSRLAENERETIVFLMEKMVSPTFFRGIPL